jgi:hypothetical protein
LDRKLNADQKQMIEYIDLFLARQRLVFQALFDIRPGILISVGLLKPEDRPKRANMSDTGYWGENQEWKYFRHGLGLRLFHTITEEPIEWNASNERTFDRYWFSNWLYWYSQHDSKGKTEAIANTPKAEFRDFVFNILTALLEAKVLIREYPTNIPNEYTLVTTWILY